LDQLVYDSYGNIVSETSSSSGDRFKFTGREWDAELGLYFYRARYYGPSDGRFESEDPTGFSAGDPDLYRYVGNRPANATDPSGLDDLKPVRPPFGSPYWDDLKPLPPSRRIIRDPPWTPYRMDVKPNYPKGSTGPGWPDRPGGRLYRLKVVVRDEKREYPVGGLTLGINYFDSTGKGAFIGYFQTDYFGIVNVQLRVDVPQGTIITFRAIQAAVPKDEPWRLNYPMHERDALEVSTRGEDAVISATAYWSGKGPPVRKIPPGWYDDPKYGLLPGYREPY
jgi:RHS repeat-associated protein